MLPPPGRPILRARFSWDGSITGDTMTSISQTQVRKLTADDIPAAARTLARAFHDDPVFSWTLPDEQRRTRLGPRSFQILLDIYLAKGQAWATPDLASVALWAPPHKWKLPASAQLRLVPKFARLFGLRFPLVLAGFETMDSHHPDDEPHWYLGILGTDPSRQGEGLGTRAIQPVLDQCDQAGEPAYLESSNPVNVPYYERRGFEIVSTFQFPRGPQVQGMWRQPR